LPLPGKVVAVRKDDTNFKPSLGVPLRNVGFAADTHDFFVVPISAMTSVCTALPVQSWMLRTIAKPEKEEPTMTVKYKVCEVSNGYGFEKTTVFGCKAR
jgi:hypothetical protein